MSEDPKVEAAKKTIAKCLTTEDKFDDRLFECVHKQLGTGRPIFNRARDEMIGERTVKWVKEKRRKRLQLTENGRRRYAKP